MQDAERTADLQLVSNTLALMGRRRAGLLNDDLLSELDGMETVIDAIAHKYGREHADAELVELLKSA